MTWVDATIYLLSFVAMYRLLSVKYDKTIQDIKNSFKSLQNDNEYLMDFVGEMNNDVIKLSKGIQEHFEPKDKKGCPVCKNPNISEFNKVKMKGIMNINYFCNQCSTMITVPIEKGEVNESR